MEFPRGVWRLAFESASISGFRTGSEWCEDFELDRQVHWRLWVGGAAGVTWSLTAVRGQCPENR